MGARHPTFIYFTLGRDESKHNPKPAMTLEYSGPPVDISTGQEACAQEVKRAFPRASYHSVKRPSPWKRKAATDKQTAEAWAKNDFISCSAKSGAHIPSGPSLRGRRQWGLCVSRALQKEALRVPAGSVKPRTTPSTFKQKGCVISQWGEQENNVSFFPLKWLTRGNF